MKKDRELVDKIIDSIHAYGGQFFIPDRLPSEEVCQAMTVNCLIWGNIIDTDSIRTEKIYNSFIIDVFLENYKFPIEIKVIRTQSYRPYKRAEMVEKGLGQALQYQQVYGYSLLLIYTDSKHYAKTIEEKYKKYEKTRIFVRAIDYNRFLYLQSLKKELKGE